MSAANIMQRLSSGISARAKIQYPPPSLSTWTLEHRKCRNLVTVFIPYVSCCFISRQGMRIQDCCSFGFHCEPVFALPGLASGSTREDFGRFHIGRMEKTMETLI